jgi:hypothetical protein
MAEPRGIRSNNPLGLRDDSGALRSFDSPQAGLVEAFETYRYLGWHKNEAIKFAKAEVAKVNGPPPDGTANGDWLDDAVYEAGWSLSKPLTQSRTIRGSALSALSAVSAAVIQLTQDVLPHAVVASESLTTVWPQAVRWVLIVVCIAGAWLSYSARTGAREAGAR